MALTRQEAADAIVASRLNQKSLEAVVQALQIIETTGFGTIIFEVDRWQIGDWSAKVTGKTDNVLTPESKSANLIARKK